MRWNDLQKGEVMDTVKTQRGKKVVEHQNKYFYVYSQEVDFGSFSKKYYVAQFGTKACLLILNHNSVLLVRQYRFLVDRPVWEIPGGKVEENENPAVSAVRECEEETGIRGLNVKPLIYYPLGLDCISAGSQLFYTSEFECIKKFTPNPMEVDMIKWVPFNECMEMIKSGEILDQCSIIALLYYQNLKNAGQTPYKDNEVKNGI